MKCATCGWEGAGDGCPRCAFLEEEPTLSGSSRQQLMSDAGAEFLADHSGEGERVTAPVPVLSDRQFATMMKDEAVLALKAGLTADSTVLSPFEQHVARLLDGQRPVARIRKKSGLSADDLRIALGMMADNGHLVQVGVAKRKSRSRAAAAAAPPAVSAPPPPAGRATPSGLPPPVRAAPAPGPPLDPAELRRKMRAQEAFQTAMKEFQSGHPARGLLFAKMAASQDPGEPTYRALVEQWAHLEAAPPKQKKSTETDWVRVMADAQSLETLGKLDEAIALLERVLGSHPREASIHNQLGIALARKKVYDKAAEHLMRAVELDAGRPVYRANLAKVLGRAASEGMDDKVQLIVAKLTKPRF